MWIFLPVRHADEASVARVAPCVIGAGEHLGAPAAAVDKARAAMAADIRERPHHAVIAANNHDAFAEIVEAPPLARLRDVAFMANHLRRCAQERPLLGLEEFGV